MSKIGTMTKAETMQGIERLLADGYGEMRSWQTDLLTHTTYFLAWDVIAAMTPEQREYYGLTADYNFVMALPDEYRPK